MTSPTIEMGDEWVKKISRSRNLAYYFNTKTGVSQWKHPSATPEKEKGMPAAPQPRNAGITSKRAENVSQPNAAAGKSVLQDCAQTSIPVASKKSEQETSSSQKKEDSLSVQVSEIVPQIESSKKKKKKRKRKKSTSSNSTQEESPHVEHSSPFDGERKSSKPLENTTRTTMQSETLRKKVVPVCHDDKSLDTSLQVDNRDKQKEEISATIPPLIDKEEYVSRPPAKRKRNTILEGSQRKVIVSKDDEKQGSSSNVNAKAEEKKESGASYLPKKIASCESVSEMEVDRILSTEGKVLVVVDTNVLIHSITFLGTIKGKTIEGLGDIMLTIPWIVMQELDLLKGPNFMPSTPLSSSARKALNFLHKNRTDPNIKGQSYSHFLKTVKQKDVKGTSDDKILHYCLQCKKKYVQNLVVLLSNDKNLCVKASFSGVPSSGDSGFVEEIQKQVKSHGELSFSSDDNDLFSPSEDHELPGRCSPEGAIACISPMEWLSPEPVENTARPVNTKDLEILCKDVVKKNDALSTKHKPDSKKNMPPSASKQREEEKNLVVSPDTRNDTQRKPGPLSAKQSCNEMKGTTQGSEKKTENRKRPAASDTPQPSADSKEQKLGSPLDSNFAVKQMKRKYTSQLMGFLKLALVILLRHEMMEIYTDHWLDIIHKKPPWSLLEALQCIRKHYVAVFGFLLGRDNTEEIDRLVSIVTLVGEDDYFTLKQLNSFISAATTMLAPLNKSAKYKDITTKCTEDIQRVYKQWTEEIESGQIEKEKTPPKICTETSQESEIVQESEDMCISPPATSTSNTHPAETDDGAILKNQDARQDGDGMDHVTFSILSVFEAIYLVLKYHRDVIVWSFKHLASGCPIEGLPTKDESLNYLSLALPLIEAVIHSLHRLMSSSLPAAHCAEVVERIQAYDQALKLDLSLSEFSQEMLQQFILTEENRDRLVVGSQQLAEVLQQLHECRVRLCQF